MKTSDQHLMDAVISNMVLSAYEALEDLSMDATTITDNGTPFDTFILIPHPMFSNNTVTAILGLTFDNFLPESGLTLCNLFLPQYADLFLDYIHSQRDDKTYKTSLQWIQETMSDELVGATANLYARMNDEMVAGPLGAGQNHMSIMRCVLIELLMIAILKKDTAILDIDITDLLDLVDDAEEALIHESQPEPEPFETSLKH